MSKQNSPLPATPDETYQFRLYITGASPNSSRAVTNLKNILESRVKGLYRLQIIDVYQQPHIAKTVDIIALPLLVRELPLPEKRAIGDLSDENKIILQMDLKVI